MIKKEGCRVLQIWVCIPRLLPLFYAVIDHVASVCMPENGVRLIHTSLDDCENKAGSHGSRNPTVQCSLCRNDTGKEGDEEILLLDRQW